jgi:hypothetical protein
VKAQRPGGGLVAAGLIGGGFAARACGPLAVPAEGGLHPGPPALAMLLYCLGFAYALLGQSEARSPLRLHLGTTGLLGGALVDVFAGKTAIGLALSVAGAALMILAFWQAAVRSQSGFRRIALLVAATGPALFALHAVAFALGGDLLQARFLRLGATAALALPLLAVIYRFHPLGGDNRPTRVARTLVGIGMVAMPLVLVLSAFVDARLKYALGPASDCFTVALIVACFQAWRSGDRAALAGFGTVLASMLLGKVMGFYSFDGPLSAPAALAAYADAWRVSLRHFHIDLMVLGYALLLWPTLVHPRTFAAAGLALAAVLLVPAMGAWSPWAGMATVLWLIVFWRRRAIA